jgi:hypothetical protein
MSISANSRLDGRLNLEQQKKRAKELLQAVKNAEPEAIARFQRHHPGDRCLCAEALPTLSDAQLVIARECGLPSWPKLKAHIEQLDQARQAIAQGQPVALDADLKTLHIRCGSDIQHKLQIAGFSGDFLEFADPYCQGPVIEDADFEQFLQVRSSFVAQAYRIDPNDARSRLQREYQRLQDSQRYARVVIWMEHDAYDQLILSYLLRHFSNVHPRSTALELIYLNAFPGVQPFVGLGQLPPEALRALWQQRSRITIQQLRLGQQVWQALTHPSPKQVHRLVTTGTPAVPTMAAALRRHLQELPWRHDGLSLTQRLTLSIVAERGPIAAKTLFRIFTFEQEPLPYLGDTMYWQELDWLSQGDRPALQPRSQTTAWADQMVQLTPTGQALLDRSIDWRRIEFPDRWLGGVHIGTAPNWVWDEQRQQPISLTSADRRGN